MTGSGDNAARLDHPLLALDPGPRARQACARLGIATVAQFLAMPAAEFVARSGCSQRTRARLEQRVLAWLCTTGAGADAQAAGDGERPLLGLVRQPAAALALRRLGITTVGRFLATPKEDLLACPGFHERAWQSIRDRIVATRRIRAAGAGLLPPVMLDLPLRRMALPRPVLTRLEQLGCATCGHVLSLPDPLFAIGGELGPDAAAAIRGCLEQLFRVALAQVDEAPDAMELDWPSLHRRIQATLSEVQRELLDQVVGIGQPPHALRDLASTRRVDMAGLQDLAAGARQRLHTHEPALMCRLRFEVARELDAFDGAIDGSRLAPGTVLHAIARGTQDAQLPLRLCAFCFPADLFLVDGVLTTLSRREHRRVLSAVRQAVRGQLLPMPVDQVAAAVAQRVPAVPLGLLRHVLSTSLRLTTRIDPTHGEVAVPSCDTPAARLRRLLLDEAAPMEFEDLVFAWRERFRSVNDRALQRALRTDPTFVATGPRRWSLREWHRDDLVQADAIARDLAATVLDAGGKHHVPALLAGRSLPEHVVWLVVDCLRRNPQLRCLGRGDVCPASHTRSSVLDQLIRDFRRAGGDVVLSRFLANQPAERRRLVARLLHENRLFLIPADDRIDVLANYPFNGERLARLLAVVDATLESRHGYAPLGAVLAEVNRHDLGGTWLHEMILGEILRRHGGFDLLPGGIVAQRRLALGGWLMRKARAALRTAGSLVSVTEILAQRPELAEFAACLAQLLRQDPMVRSDGAKFELV